MDNDQEKELALAGLQTSHFLHTAEKQEAKTRHLYRLCRVTASQQASDAPKPAVPPMSSRGCLQQ